MKIRVKIKSVNSVLSDLLKNIWERLKSELSIALLFKGWYPLLLD
jgi:hypothetical protein